MMTYPSLFKNIKYTNCNCERKQFTYGESISAYEMYEVGLINLKYTLVKHLSDKMLACSNCNEETTESKCELINSYLTLDSEFIHEERNSKIFQCSVKKESSLYTSFNEVPLQLILNNKLF